MALIGHVFQDVPDKEQHWTRTGNVRPLHVPCGVYPAQGEDSWVAIDVATDSQWAGFVRCLGLQGLVDEHQLSGLDNRVAKRTLIDGILRDWTSSRTAREASETLQAHGVPADKVARADDLVADQHLADRGTLFTMTRGDEPEVSSRRTAIGPPWKFSRSDVKNDVWSPELGEDTEYVLSEILHYSPEQIEALQSAGVLT
jgi:crotonobetainyl-CoA:carnitine CoA-transferase CaiB-like acyl-CoA transferase